VCGNRFWVELTEDDKQRKAEWSKAEHGWHDWMASTGKMLATATDARDIAVLVDALATEFDRIRSTFPVADAPQDVYLGAWQRFVRASKLVPTHDLVVVRFEKQRLRSASEEHSRRPLWRCFSGSYDYIDVDGDIVSCEPSTYAVAGPKAGTGSFVVATGRPCKLVAETRRTAKGPWYCWSIGGDGGMAAGPLADYLRDSAFPVHIAGIMRGFLGKPARDEPSSATR
jgi:hypothetical protein